MIRSDESVAGQQDAGLEHSAVAQQAPPQGESSPTMSSIEETPRTYSGALLAVIAVALLCAIGGLIWTYTLSGRLAHEEVALTEANQQNARLAAQLRETDARLKVTAEELGKSLG